MSEWQAIESGSEVHVYPLEDLRPHVIDGECWCKPFDDDGITVHNSMDGREHFERGRKPS